MGRRSPAWQVCEYEVGSWVGIRLNVAHLLHLWLCLSHHQLLILWGRPRLRLRLVIFAIFQCHPTCGGVWTKC